MLKQIAHIESLYATKFGVPRQAGLVDAPARVVFEEEYRVPEAVRGLEEFDYVWLVWGFHLVDNRQWSPTVRPPRLGGNKRMGVFATRSPFRPNPIGLSSVKLLGVDIDQALGPVLRVSGADLVDGTPVYDIKPYLPYADSHPDARGGFADKPPVAALHVDDPDGMTDGMTDDLRRSLFASLAQDPRPHYQHDPDRIYTIAFAGREVSFKVVDDTAIIVKKC